MSTRKPGFSRRQHIELGAQVIRMYEELLHASVLLSNSYPHSAKAVRLADAVLNKLNDLRCELDSLSANELPGDDEWSPAIYYGSWEARERWLAQYPVDGDEPGLDGAR